MKPNKLKLTNPYLMLPEECYTRVERTPPKKTFFIHANEDVAKKGDFTVADTLFEIAKNPYAEHK